MPAPRILLVYANPAVTASPVPPYGAERIAQALRMAGCDARVISPWLELKPAKALEAALDAFAPDLVGFSVRNVDDALVVRSGEGVGDLDTTFYLPEIKPLVDRVARRGIPILLGGAGLSTCPEGVMRWLRVEHAIAGAADDLAWRLGRALASGVAFPEALPADPRVLRLPAARRRARGRTVRPGRFVRSAEAGWAPLSRGDGAPFRAVPGPTPREPAWIVLAKARGGRVPVAISAGCDRRCGFCVEAAFVGGAVRPRAVEDVVGEVTLLRKAGVRRIWLAASELNVPDARHATAVLRAIAAAKLGVEVSGFLQPAPVDDALLDAFAEVGVDPAALSWEFGHLDDELLRAGAGPANRRSLDRLLDLYLRRGHAVLGGSALFGAHPKETEASVQRAIATARAFDAALPGGFGLAWAAGGRVYETAPLGRWVAGHGDEAAPHLYGRWTPGFAAPLVYSRPGSPRELFRVVAAGLAGCRGPMQALNAESVTDPGRLGAERWVNRAILAADAGAYDVGAAACRTALRRDPTHAEALKQLGLILANGLGDRTGALRAFRRLRVQLRGEAAGEIDRVIRRLGG